ncbi:hypothetical protein OAW20_02200 [Gammaproteobacteria bacterium]|nr:hypothetical protein [Gammaproteobacteria bacterium]
MKHILLLLKLDGDQVTLCKSEVSKDILRELYFDLESDSIDDDSELEVTGRFVI